MGIKGDLDDSQSKNMNIKRKDKLTVARHANHVETNDNNSAESVKGIMITHTSMQSKVNHNRNFFFIRPPNNKEVKTRVVKSGIRVVTGEGISIDVVVQLHMRKHLWNGGGQGV